VIDNSIIKNAKILIVDDVNDNIKLLGKLLRAYKAKISVATNGRQAVEIAKELLPDLVLMDVNMPEKNGFEATGEILANESTSDTPIIFLTALSDINDVIEGFDKGGLDYVTKPFNTKVLISRIKTHLSIRFQKQELKELNKNLKETDIQKTKFLSIVSHDLRSPMSGLVGLIKMINSDFDSFDKEELKDSLVSMEDALKHQYMFLETMLRWGNLQFNKVQLEMNSLEIKYLIEQIFNVLKVNTENKNIDLVSDFQTDKIFGDYNLLYSIFHNLIVNAIKYTNEGGTVTVSIKELENEYLCSVKDTGIGMPKKIADNLFRVDSVHSRPGTNNEKGTGLGLIVSYESVIKHGGKIWVETKEGEGTEFFFTLKKEQ
jgi:two-component system sensor histidine kinase/response regulator